MHKHGDVETMLFRFWTPAEDRRLLDLPRTAYGAVVGGYLTDLVDRMPDRTMGAARGRLCKLRKREAATLREQALRDSRETDGRPASAQTLAGG